MDCSIDHGLLGKSQVGDLSPDGVEVIHKFTVAARIEKVLIRCRAISVKVLRIGVVHLEEHGVNSDALRLHIET